MLIMEGTALSLPIFPARARSKEPPTEPSIIARTASSNRAAGEKRSCREN